jgi:hypothetical protein
MTAGSLVKSAIAPWHRLGLRLLPREGMWPLAVASGIGLVFGVWMALADAFLFRPIVPAAQTAFVRSTAALDRIAAGVPLAALDEIEFRWLLLSTVLWFVTPSARAQQAGQGPRAWAAIAAVAVLYALLHPAEMGTPLLDLREATLYVSAGMLWGWLFCRWGLVAAMAGHAGAYLTLEPLLGWLFSR